MDVRIEEQINVLKFALELGQRQITEVETRAKLKFEDLSLPEQKEFLKNDTVCLYLKNFWRQYEFLIKKLETETDERDFHFYLPLIRILTENYAELLFFLNQDEKNQIGIFAGNYLLNLSDHYRFIAIKSQPIKNEYDRFTKLLSAVLSAEGITFPSDIDMLSKIKLKELGFDFPQIEKIFEQAYFAASSSDTFACWAKDEPSNFYNKYYRSHSGYTHRSFANQTSAATGTEIFWIIQFMCLTAQLMLELSNRLVFSKKYQSDWDNLIKKIEESYPKFLQAWDEKRASITEAKPKSS